MINVAVYTRGNAFITLLENENWIITLLIVDDEDEKKRVKSIVNERLYKRIKKIITVSDFFKNDDMKYFQRSDIEENYHSQVKFYQYFHRFTSDIQIMSDAYFRSLAYTKKVFQENNIDCLINMNFNHGNCDTLLIKNAVARGIPSYNIEPMLFGKMIVYDNLCDDLIPINSEFGDCKESIFYKVNNDLYDYEENSKYKFIKKTFGKLFYTMFGELGWKLLSGIASKSLKFREMFGEKSLYDYWKNYIRLLWAKKIISRMEVAPNYKESYIFFPLHFEPEATVNGRSLLTNQLNVIRIIAQTMPDGMVCYVKEHPHQFSVNTHRFRSFLYSAGNFKTKEFYKELSKIERIKIIHHSVKSEELIRKSQAVAIMSGTVGAEATLFNKPVIVFAGKRTIYRKCKQFFCVESYKECKDAMDKILNVSKCVYDDFSDVCKIYLADDNIEGFRHAIKCIEKDYNNKISIR